MIVIIYVMLRI